MKKTACTLLFIFTAAILSAQTLQDAIVQAKAAYAAGQYRQAVGLIDVAASTYATGFDNKTVIADAYNEIGEKEYAKKNLLNAYECYRKAVKIYPTHKAASENFWKIKQNYDVATLKNEGANSSSTATVGTDGGTTFPSDGASGTAYSAAQLDELKKYQTELARQSDLIKQLQTAYANARSQPASVDPQTAAYNREILNNLTKLYQNAVSMKDPRDLDILTAQMNAYRAMFERQQTSQSTLTWVILCSFIGLILVIVLTLLILYRIARRRRKQRFAYASDYDGLGLGAAQSPAGLEDRRPLLLAQEAAFPDAAAGEAKGKETEQETDLYRDVIRAERLKEMANEKKYGSLKWDTLRDYIGELEKELRSEILYVVENKLNSFDGDDYAAVLPVLFPFFTDSDDYLRDKAHRLLERAIEKQAGPAPTDLLLDYDGADRKKAKDPLSVASLLKHVDKLKDIKPGRREHSVNVSRYARGMGLVLKLPAETQELLYKTALVHDIGYALLDRDTLDEIAEKKELTDKETDFIRTHTEKGVAYFKDYAIPEEMRQGILYHHERNDGSGYPKGLVREKIPMFAKIIGIADMFDALTTNRVFREKMSFDSAVVILKDLGRSKIEAEYMEALVEYLKSSGKIRR
ncbi:MAG: HD domain-containing protein [Spirochaetales bacterium]|nr:HD domain-containing protein [Spirochaetales bacterium]